MSDEEALTKGVERDCVAQWLGRRPACCGRWRFFVGLRVGWRDAWSGFVFLSMRREQSTETKYNMVSNSIMIIPMRIHNFGTS